MLAVSGLVPLVMPYPTITIYCDGSCSPNPGRGSYGAVIISNGKHSALAGVSEEPRTTSQRMEITAAIRSLEALAVPSSVDIFSDSRYLVRGAQREPKATKANYDLWLRLKEVSKPHSVKYHWIKGHSGHPYQERADKLAVHMRG